MVRIRIDSPQDPRIAPYVDLRNKGAPQRQGRFIAEGELVVRRLLESRFTVESLLVAESQLERIDVPSSVPVYYAPLEVVEAIAGFRFHRGILACGLRPAASDWALRCPPPSQEATIVVCSRVQDPANLGGVLRNCAAFGVDQVLVGENSADPYTRRVLRVSMATALTLNLSLCADLEKALARLHRDFGFHCVATVLDAAASPLSLTARPSRLALILGNEYAGVEWEVQQLCQARVTIPMSLGTDSLNVAAASGIFLYHFTQVAARDNVA